MKRPTIRSIAEATGFSTSTVSMALRNSPRLSGKTKQLVNKQAKLMGYQPHPEVSRLMSHIRASRRLPRNSSLAYINPGATASYLKNTPFLLDIYDGIEEKCHELGYQLESIWTEGGGITDRRLNRILQTRNIQGLIFPPFYWSLEPREFDLDWPKYAVVSISHGFESPTFDKVAVNRNAAFAQCLAHLLETGHQRIGVVHNLSPYRQVNFNNNAMIGWYHTMIPKRRIIPSIAIEQRDSDRVAAWIENHRPDAVITQNPLVPGFLRKLGHAVPRDISVVGECYAPPRSRLTRSQVNTKSLGRLAVKILEAKLLQDDLGVPDEPTITLVGTNWHDGRTVRERGPADPLAHWFQTRVW